MAFQPTTDGVRVWCGFTSPRGAWGNVLWFSRPDIDYVNMLALVNQVKEQYRADLQGMMHDETDTGQFLAYDMRTSGGVVVPSNTALWSGTNTGDPLPLANAIVVTHRTYNRGRAYRGRTYLSGFTETSMTDGIWTGGAIVQAGLLFYNILNWCSVNGWNFGVRSGQLDGVQRPSGIVTGITQSEVRNNVPGTQRARNQRG